MGAARGHRNRKEIGRMIGALVVGEGDRMKEFAGHVIFVSWREEVAFRGRVSCKANDS